TCPLARSITMPCNGHVTDAPCTRPADKGPPLCGQRSVIAYTRPSPLLNTAISSCPLRRTTRAPRAGISLTAHTGVHLLQTFITTSDIQSFKFGRGYALFHAVLPRILFKRQGKAQARVKGT